ncbi:hypothetical protein ACNF7N_09635 [Campylobacter coli]
MDGYSNGMINAYGYDIPNDRSEESAQLRIDSMILTAKLAALTHLKAILMHQDILPEKLEWYYKRHKLDRLLDPEFCYL